MAFATSKLLYFGPLPKLKFKSYIHTYFRCSELYEMSKQKSLKENNNSNMRQGTQIYNYVSLINFNKLLTIDN